MRFLKRQFWILQFLRSLPAHLFKKHLLKGIEEKKKLLYARKNLSTRDVNGNWTHSLLSGSSEAISRQASNTDFRRKKGFSHLGEFSEKCLGEVLANEFVCGFHMISGAKGILRRDEYKIKDRKWHYPILGTTMDWVWLEHRLFWRTDKVRTSSLEIGQDIILKWLACIPCQHHGYWSWWIKGPKRPQVIEKLGKQCTTWKAEVQKHHCSSYHSVYCRYMSFGDPSPHVGCLTVCQMNLGTFIF